MATAMMAHTQIISSMAMSAPAFKCRSGHSSARAGLRALPSTRLPERFGPLSKQTAKSVRKVTVSVLEASRVEASQDMAPNPTEVLLEKLAAMGKPNDTEYSKMSDLADRLFLWDDVPKLGTYTNQVSVRFPACIREFWFPRDYLKPSNFFCLGFKC